MKYIVLVSLLSLSFCVSDVTNQITMETQKVSPLSRALKNMLFIQSQSQQLDYGRLINAIDELEQSVKDAKEEEATSFQKDALQHDSDVDFYNNQITQYKTEAAEHQIDLTDLTSTRDNLQKLLDDNLQELSTMNELKAQLVAQMKQDADSANAQIKEYSDAIEAIDQVVDLLKSVSSGSLIEKDHYQQAKETFSSKMKNMRILYQPLAVALSEMAQSNFADSEMVQKILKLLYEIKGELNDSAQSIAVQAKGLEEKNNEILKTYNEKISNLSDVLIPQFKQDIEVKDGEIKTKTQLLNDAKENQQTAQDNLTAVENEWIARQNENSKLMKQYDDDLSLIQNVRQTFDRAGIKKSQ